MNLYGINYKKINDGYVKIIDTINSTENTDQLKFIPNMINSWVNLVDHYCDEVCADRSNRHRKKDANALSDVAMMMVEDIKETYNNQLRDLTSEDYEGSFKPTRIKSLRELAQDE